MIADPLLFDEDHHADALEQLTLRALNAGEPAAAFRYADRRCRIPPIAKPHHYALRAEASYQCGERDAAIADLARALELAPDNLVANRRMLAWAEGAPQIEAARRLVRQERDVAVLASAIEVLRDAGEGPFAAIEHTDGQIGGWAVWSDAMPLQVTIGEGRDVTSTAIPPDPRHPLQDCLGSAARFALQRLGSGQPLVVSLQVGPQTIIEQRIRGVAQRPSPQATPQTPAPGADAVNAWLARNRPANAAAVSLAVIVPVYDDYEATKACLDSLLEELERLPGSRAILIDDAAPDLRIRAHLETLGRHASVRLIRNLHNLGFVESVNHALAAAPDGDIVLLNADTILPPGCLGRLRDVSRAAPSIGTVTPLSNNGEFTSFPVPNEANAVLSFEDICKLDAAAAAANAGTVVDIPNGIGFCLYVTRACLNAVGRLSDLYHRGYFEDVDLCLRAREHGFRNVCAPSVYIGHVGSRSFGAEKRSLVVQNLAVLEARFPRYRPECAAFVSADPLRARRAAIELAVAPEPGATVLVTGSGPLAATSLAHAHALIGEGGSALILEIRAQAQGPVGHIFDPGQGRPQSLAFRLSDAVERSALSDYLERARPARIEIVDPTHVPQTLLELLSGLEVPLDLLIADAGLVCPRGTLMRPDGTLCQANSDVACEGCVAVHEMDTDAAAGTAWRARWADVSNQADRIIVPDTRAGAFARRFMPHQPTIELTAAAARPAPGKGQAKTRRRRSSRQSRAAERVRSSLAAAEDVWMETDGRSGQTRSALGVLAVTGNAADYALMRDVTRAITGDRPSQPIIVLGRTIDDLGLMRLGNVFVTSSIEADEFEPVLRRYAVSALFIPVRRPLFGHPVIDRASAGALPTAYFDWSFGGVPCREGDLALDPAAANIAIARALGQWIGQQ